MFMDSQDQLHIHSETKLCGGFFGLFGVFGGVCCLVFFVTLKTHVSMKGFSERFMNSVIYTPK